MGVVSYVPNVQRLCERSDIDVHARTGAAAPRRSTTRALAQVLTAGSDKRTVDVVGVVTPEDERKAREELRLIHDVFKAHCCKYRPRLADDIDSLASGAAWLGAHALSLGLVDAVDTSDDYLARLERAAGVPRGFGRQNRFLGRRTRDFEVFDVVREKPKGPLTKALFGGDEDDVLAAAPTAASLRGAFPRLLCAPLAAGLRWRRALRQALSGPAVAEAVVAARTPFLAARPGAFAA